MNDDLQKCMTGLVGGEKKQEPKKEEKPSALMRIIQIRKGKK